MNNAPRELSTAEYARLQLNWAAPRLDRRASAKMIKEICRQVFFWLDWGGLKLEEFNPSPKALARLAAYQLTK